jgi:hypothetical protein
MILIYLDVNYLILIVCIVSLLSDRLYLCLFVKYRSYQIEVKITQQPLVLVHID